MTAAKQAPGDFQPLAGDRFAVVSTATLLDWARSAHRRAQGLREQAEAQRSAAARIRAQRQSGQRGAAVPPVLLRLHAAEAQVVHLRRAQVSNRRIGMAIGILMAQHRMTEAKAFDALRTASSHRNLRLYSIAEEVIYTGRLDVDGEPPAIRHRSRRRR